MIMDEKLMVIVYVQSELSNFICGCQAVRAHNPQNSKNETMEALAKSKSDVLVRSLHFK
jgi:hypothetical protein